MSRLAPLAFALALWTWSAAAALAQNNLQTPHLTLNGQTQQLVKPDAYTLIVGVETFGETHVVAMAENARIADRVIAEAKQLGVAAADLRTGRIELHTIDTAGRRFRAQNLVYVTLRDIAKSDQMLAALINAGANRIHGVRPVVRRDDDLLNKLRADAVVKAQKAAAETAAAAGVRLGRILSINAQYYDWTSVMMGAQYRGASADLNSVPIEPGMIPVSITVSVTWSIEQ